MSYLPVQVSYSDDNGQTWTIMPMCDDESRFQFNNAMKDLGDRLQTGLNPRLEGRERAAAILCPLLTIPDLLSEPAFYPQMSSISSVSRGFVPFSNFDR